MPDVEDMVSVNTDNMSVFTGMTDAQTMAQASLIGEGLDIYLPMN